MKYKKNQNELLVHRAYEVIQNLELKSLDLTHENPKRFPTANSTISLNEVKKEIMRLGYEEDEINYMFVNKVFKQIVFLLKYS
jgi:hypothetical protein